jgi:choline dehydrogenase-like flavoprotein
MSNVHAGASTEKIWDYIIIGTGMGGGPVGLRLAQAGFSVLFLEKGRSPLNPDSLKGQFAELFPQTVETQDETLKRAGRWSQEVSDCSGSKPQKIMPFIGSGVGGSSALYGAVLQRFRPSEYAQWPVSSAALETYYQQAETLFRVQKSESLSHPGNQQLFSYLCQQNLHPYHLPFAIENKKGCSGCQSFLCAQNCKNESGKICIEKAVADFGATLLADCNVEKIEISGSLATGVTGTRNGETFVHKSRQIILAAGALQSPVLLQKSGIGARSGQVGRNLMRHFVDLYALKIDSDPQNGRAKEIGFDDFYQHEGQTLGTVQSFGRLPPISVILQEMETDFNPKRRKSLALLFRLIKPFLRFFIQRLTSGRLVMASILEDSPSPENRVWSENGKLCIAYTISRVDQEKIHLMRKKLKKLFAPLSLFFIPSAEKNKMLAHVCGTCRMGTDPMTSVVDPNNKVHGFDNLYITDSSFFPTSGGTNPALTIAANSLRVADLLIANEKLTRQGNGNSSGI